MSEPSNLVGNRRQHRRGRVPAVAVLPAPDKSVAVWFVRDLSIGGASIMGDSMLISGQRFALKLYLAGHEPLELAARVLRRQLAFRRGQCAVVFENVTAEQSAVLTAAIEAWKDPAAMPVPPDTLVASPSDVHGPLMRELAAIGRSALQVPSPFAAAAWLHRGAVAVLVEQNLIEVGGWNFMNFVRDTWPQIKRLVIAKDIHGFRLNLALRSGLVDAVVEKPFRAAQLAAKLGVEPAGRRRASG
jgi:hypothetical protein